MSFLSSMIITLCMGTNGQTNAACNHALDAGAQQTGIAEDFSSAEQNATSWGNNFVNNRFGRTGRDTLGSFLFVMKTASDKTLIIPIPTAGLADSFQTQLKPDSAMITIRWGF